MKQQNAPQIGTLLRSRIDNSLAVIIGYVEFSGKARVKFLTRGENYAVYNKPSMSLGILTLQARWEVISD